jgi:hypothetical protein
MRSGRDTRARRKFPSPFSRPGQGARFPARATSTPTSRFPRPDRRHAQRRPAGRRQHHPGMGLNRRPGRQRRAQMPLQRRVAATAPRTFGCKGGSRRRSDDRHRAHPPGPRGDGGSQRGTAGRAPSRGPGGRAQARVRRQPRLGRESLGTLLYRLVAHEWRPP